MKQRLLPVLLVLALLSGCAGKGTGADQSQEGEYKVYFLSQEGDVLRAEPRFLPEGQEEAGGLLTRLLSGPESAVLTSPFPRSTQLRGWKLEEGLLTVDLSESYGGLSGAELTLADGCIVLTLCQLPQVEKVYLTVEGRSRPFRDQVFTLADFLMESGSAGGEIEVELWFPRGGGMEREKRTLRLAAGDRVDIAAVQALLDGPESGELEPVCPEGTTLRALTRRGGSYTVDVSEKWLEGGEDPRRTAALERTLQALTPEVEVTLWVEGQRTDQK